MRMFALLCVAIAMPAQARTIPPVNECAVDKAFTVYQTRLNAAVKARDSRVLLGLVSPDIDFGYGDAKGRGAFTREWKLDTGRASELWGVLDTILKLGCAVDKNMMVMPRLSKRLPLETDAYSTFVVTGTNVNLRESPKIDSPVTARLSWDVVESVDWPKGSEQVDGWTRVKTNSGKTGYISAQFLRDNLEYTAYFEKRGGNWTMTGLNAGD